jgi:triosephosphate isomerase
MIVAANFKTNKTRSETIKYLNELKKIDFESVKVAVFPPQSALIEDELVGAQNACLLYTSPSPRDGLLSRMPSSA